MKYKVLTIVSLLIGAQGFSEDTFHSSINNPEYFQGELSTSEGGVVRGEDFRIQARSLRLRKENNETVLYGTGDVAFLYHGTLFLADRLEYNLKSKTGKAYDVKALYGIWYLGAKEVTILPTGSVITKKAYITPEDNLSKALSLNAKEMSISSTGVMHAEGITLRTFSVPIFYFPSYQTALKKPDESPITYGLTWISGQGPELLVRYKVFGSEDTSVFLRGDFRPSRGFGGAFETYCKQPNKSFVTKNYLAHDTFYRDDNPNRKKTRYRLQGNFSLVAPNNKTFTRLRYDKFSDRNMPEDFPAAAFELDAAETTDISLRRRTDFGLFGMRAAPRINGFQGFTQQLPSGFFRSTPYELLKDTLFFQSDLKTEYLKYTPASAVFTDSPPFESGRLASKSILYGYGGTTGFQVTPYVGYDLLAYTNSPSSRAKVAFSFLYGGTAQYGLQRNYATCMHRITPFATWTGITTPTTRTDGHFIFSLHDGIDRLNQMEYGIKNRIGFHTADVQADFSLLSFFGQSALDRFIPKGVVLLKATLPKTTVLQKLIWNFQFQTLDFAKSLVEWTFTKDAAFSVEFQHRSPYYYRKDDLDNYILDVNRAPSSLLGTPISDKRDIVLTRAQFRVTELWWLQFQSHHGFGRDTQRAYTEFKLDLFTRLSSHWRAKLSIAQTTLGTVFGGELKIIK